MGFQATEPDLTLDVGGVFVWKVCEIPLFLRARGGLH
jgi:hypothetical protein